VVTLRAGSNGVYLPDFFGSFDSHCDYGFAATILTQRGASATKSGLGCGNAGHHPYVEFKKLNPGEVRTWTMDLPTKSIGHGHYFISAEYLSSDRDMDPTSVPLADRALVGTGHIIAPRVSIKIR
jgi:hypothetical protein